MKFISKLLIMFIAAGLIVFTPYITANAQDNAVRSGDIIKMSGDVYVNEGTTVNGNVVALSGNIYVDGSVTGDVVSVLGDIMVNKGTVLGDAVAVKGRVTVGQNGKVMGDTVEALGGIFGSGGNNENTQGNGVNINISPWGIRFPGIIFSLVFSLVVFGAACLVYLIMPDKIEKMASTVGPNLGKRIGIGFLTLIGSPIALIIMSIILAITIIGIIIIPFLWIGFTLAAFTAIVPVYVFIGRSVIQKQKISGYGAIAVGMLMIWVVQTALSFGGFYTGWINVILSMAVFVLGSGTLLDYIFSNRKKKPPYITDYTYQPQGGGAGYDAHTDKGHGEKCDSDSIPKEDNK